MTWTCSIAIPQLGMASQVDRWRISWTLKPVEEDGPDQICIFGDIQAPGVED